jgi:hypothetical protein
VAGAVGPDESPGTDSQVLVRGCRPCHSASADCSFARSASSLSPAAGSVRLWDMYPDKSLMLRNIPALKYNPTPPAADCATPSGPVHRTEAAACRTDRLYRILVRQIHQSQLFQSKQHSGSVFQPGISKPRLKRALNDPLADTRRLPRHRSARSAIR